MYRASEEALRARLHISERALRHEKHRAASAEVALSDAAGRLGRLRDGVAETGGGAIFVLASPWAVLPFAGAMGISARRRWGWLVAVVAAVLWLPTPVFPLSLVVLLRLFGDRTREVFFAT
ncbi:MAG: hypothetical protein JRH11_01960 [Deltaproteobacteria bacterium]|nr:hypothetical protein [Deltaproteobacteria bacterium]